MLESLLCSTTEWASCGRKDNTPTYQIHPYWYFTQQDYPSCKVSALGSVLINQRVFKAGSFHNCYIVVKQNIMTSLRKPHPDQLAIATDLESPLEVEHC